MQSLPYRVAPTSTPTRRRQTVIAMLITGLALVASGSPASAQPHTERGWSDGTQVTLQITQESATSTTAKQAPEFVIAPVDASSPLNPAEDGFGPYDLTVAAPAGNRGSYSSQFHVFLLLPDDSAPAGAVAWREVQAGGDVIPLAFAADLGNGLVPLTSVDRVQQAAAAGLVDIVDTGITEVCHVTGAPH